MTAAPLSSLNAATIATLPSDAVEPTAVAIATEIDRLEALLAAHPALWGEFGGVLAQYLDAVGRA